MTNQKHQFDLSPVRVEDLPPVLRLSLRVRPAHRGRLGRALGLDLPARIGARMAADGTEALCLGPDEWLIAAPEGADLASAARAIYPEVPHSLADISDREISLRLSGPADFRMDVWRSFAPHVRALLAQVQGELAAGL